MSTPSTAPFSGLLHLDASSQEWDATILPHDSDGLNADAVKLMHRVPAVDEVMRVFKGLVYRVDRRCPASRQWDQLQGSAFCSAMIEGRTLWAKLTESDPPMAGHAGSPRVSSCTQPAAAGYTALLFSLPHEVGNLAGLAAVPLRRVSQRFAGMTVYVERAKPDGDTHFLLGSLIEAGAAFCSVEWQSPRAVPRETPRIPIGTVYVPHIVAGHESRPFPAPDRLTA